jgi:hypothetical protein
MSEESEDAGMTVEDVFEEAAALATREGANGGPCVVEIRTRHSLFIYWAEILDASVVVVHNQGRERGHCVWIYAAARPLAAIRECKGDIMTWSERPSEEGAIHGLEV